LVAACSSDSAPPPEEPIPPQSGTFDALTYNVAGLPQGISSSEPELYIPQISALLNAYDLVLVQEDFWYHEELIADVEHPHQSEPLAEEEYVTFVGDGLNRFSQFELGALKREQWVICFGDATTGSGDCLASKGFSLSRTTFGDRVTIDVYNLHADAGGGPEDIDAREQGFQQLVAFINDNSAGHAVVVGGDTNLHDDDAVDVSLLSYFMDETGLQEACPYLSCGEEHIDRFFFRSSSKVEVLPTAWSVADEFVDAMDNDLSDHPAIQVSFAWQTL
jgi:hypothetical protein